MIKPLSRSVLKGVAYLLFLIVSTVILLEIALRLAFGDPHYYWNNRYLFVPAGGFENVSERLWTYGRDMDYREVAIYGFPQQARLPFSGFRVEYDCRFKTNNLGFPQQRDFDAGDRVTLVLGDSFTAGQGGCPWMQQLEQSNPQWSLLNAGLMGTGLPVWSAALDYVREKGIEVEALVLIAISNDFKRKPWVWNAKVLGCLDHGECSGSEYWHPLTLDESQQSLLERARQRSLQRSPKTEQQSLVGPWLARVSRLAGVIAALLDHDQIDEAKQLAKAKPHPDTLPALEKFSSLGIPVRVLMVPQRNEAALGSRNLDSLMAEQLLRQYGLEFSWCDLGAGDFMPLDGHPTAKGYQKLAACLEGVLRDIGVASVGHGTP